MKDSMSSNRYHNIYLDNHYHFCTASIVDFLPVLSDPECCQILLDIWQKLRKRYQVKINGFVIMPNHVHLLLFGRGESICKFMQYFLQESSRKIKSNLVRKANTGDKIALRHCSVVLNQAHTTVKSRVWKERFRAVPLNKEEAILTKLNYIHNNPVIKGLVAEPSMWRWSSYLFYVNKECVISIDPLFDDSLIYLQ